MNKFESLELCDAMERQYRNVLTHNPADLEEINFEIEGLLSSLVPGDEMQQFSKRAGPHESLFNDGNQIVADCAERCGRSSSGSAGSSDGVFGNDNRRKSEFSDMASFPDNVESFSPEIQIHSPRGKIRKLDDYMKNSGNPSGNHDAGVNDRPEPGNANNNDADDPLASPLKGLEDDTNAPPTIARCLEKMGLSSEPEDPMDIKKQIAAKANLDLDRKRKQSAFDAASALYHSPEHQSLLELVNRNQEEQRREEIRIAEQLEQAGKEVEEARLEEEERAKKEKARDVAEYDNRQRKRMEAVEREKRRMVREGFLKEQRVFAVGERGRSPTAIELREMREAAEEKVKQESGEYRGGSHTAYADTFKDTFTGLNESLISLDKSINGKGLNDSVLSGVSQGSVLSDFGETPAFAKLRWEDARVRQQLKREAERDRMKKEVDEARIRVRAAEARREEQFRQIVSGEWQEKKRTELDRKREEKEAFMRKVDEMEKENQMQGLGENENNRKSGTHSTDDTITFSKARTRNREMLGKTIEERGQEFSNQRGSKADDNRQGFPHKSTLEKRAENMSDLWTKEKNFKSSAKSSANDSSPNEDILLNINETVFQPETRSKKTATSTKSPGGVSVGGRSGNSSSAKSSPLEVEPTRGTRLGSQTRKAHREAQKSSTSRSGRVTNKTGSTTKSNPNKKNKPIGIRNPDQLSPTTIEAFQSLGIAVEDFQELENVAKTYRRQAALMARQRKLKNPNDSFLDDLSDGELQREMKRRQVQRIVQDELEGRSTAKTDSVEDREERGSDKRRERTPSSSTGDKSERRKQSAGRETGRKASAAKESKESASRGNKSDSSSKKTKSALRHATSGSTGTPSGGTKKVDEKSKNENNDASEENSSKGKSYNYVRDAFKGKSDKSEKPSSAKKSKTPSSAKDESKTPTTQKSKQKQQSSKGKPPRAPENGSNQNVSSGAATGGSAKMTTRPGQKNRYAKNDNASASNSRTLSRVTSTESLIASSLKASRVNSPRERSNSSRESGSGREANPKVKPSSQKSTDRGRTGRSASVGAKKEESKQKAVKQSRTAAKKSKNDTNTEKGVTRRKHSDSKKKNRDASPKNSKSSERHSKNKKRSDSKSEADKESEDAESEDEIAAAATAIDDMRKDLGLMTGEDITTFTDAIISATDEVIESLANTASDEGENSGNQHSRSYGSGNSGSRSNQKIQNSATDSLKSATDSNSSATGRPGSSATDRSPTEPSCSATDHSASATDSLSNGKGGDSAISGGSPAEEFQDAFPRKNNYVGSTIGEAEYDPGVSEGPGLTLNFTGEGLNFSGENFTMSTADLKGSEFQRDLAVDEIMRRADFMIQQGKRKQKTPPSPLPGQARGVPYPAYGVKTEQIMNEYSNTSGSQPKAAQAGLRLKHSTIPRSQSNTSSADGSPQDDVMPTPHDTHSKESSPQESSPQDPSPVEPRRARRRSHTGSPREAADHIQHGALLTSHKYFHHYSADQHHSVRKRNDKKTPSTLTAPTASSKARSVTPTSQHKIQPHNQSVNQSQARQNQNENRSQNQNEKHNVTLTLSVRPGSKASVNAEVDNNSPTYPPTSAKSSPASPMAPLLPDTPTGLSRLQEARLFRKLSNSDPVAFPPNGNSDPMPFAAVSSDSKANAGDLLSFATASPSGGAGQKANANERYEGGHFAARAGIRGANRMEQAAKGPGKSVAQTRAKPGANHGKGVVSNGAVNKGHGGSATPGRVSGRGSRIGTPTVRAASVASGRVSGRNSARNSSCSSAASSATSQTGKREVTARAQVGKGLRSTSGSLRYGQIINSERKSVGQGALNSSTLSRGTATPTRRNSNRLSNSKNSSRRLSKPTNRNAKLPSSASTPAISPTTMTASDGLPPGLQDVLAQFKTKTFASSNSKSSSPTVETAMANLFYEAFAKMRMLQRKSLKEKLLQESSASNNKRRKRGDTAEDFPESRSRGLREAKHQSAVGVGESAKDDDDDGEEDDDTNGNGNSDLLDGVDISDADKIAFQRALVSMDRKSLEQHIANILEKGAPMEEEMEKSGKRDGNVKNGSGKVGKPVGRVSFKGGKTAEPAKNPTHSQTDTAIDIALLENHLRDVGQSDAVDESTVAKQAKEKAANDNLLKPIRTTLGLGPKNAPKAKIFSPENMLNRILSPQVEEGPGLAFEKKGKQVGAEVASDLDVELDEIANDAADLPDDDDDLDDHDDFWQNYSERKKRERSESDTQTKTIATRSGNSNASARRNEGDSAPLPPSENAQLIGEIRGILQDMRNTTTKVETLRRVPGFEGDEDAADTGADGSVPENIKASSDEEPRSDMMRQVKKMMKEKHLQAQEEEDRKKNEQVERLRLSKEREKENVNRRTGYGFPARMGDVVKQFRAESPLNRMESVVGGQMRKSQGDEERRRILKEKGNKPNQGSRSRSGSRKRVTLSDTPTRMSKINFPQPLHKNPTSATAWSKLEGNESGSVEKELLNNLLQGDFSFRGRGIGSGVQVSTPGPKGGSTVRGTKLGAGDTTANTGRNTRNPLSSATASDFGKALAMTRSAVDQGSDNPTGGVRAAVGYSEMAAGGRADLNGNGDEPPLDSPKVSNLDEGSIATLLKEASRQIELHRQERQFEREIRAEGWREADDRMRVEMGENLVHLEDDSHEDDFGNNDYGGSAFGRLSQFGSIQNPGPSLLGKHSTNISRSIEPSTMAEGFSEGRLTRMCALLADGIKQYGSDETRDLALNAESLCMRVAEMEDDDRNLHDSICQLTEKVMGIDGIDS